MLYALRFEGDSLRLQQILEFLSTAGVKDRCGGCHCLNAGVGAAGIFLPVCSGFKLRENLHSLLTTSDLLEEQSHLVACRLELLAGFALLLIPLFAVSQRSQAVCLCRGGAAVRRQQPAGRRPVRQPLHHGAGLHHVQGDAGGGAPPHTPFRPKVVAVGEIGMGEGERGNSRPS